MDIDTLYKLKTFVKEYKNDMIPKTKTILFILFIFIIFKVLKYN